jgi:hypothetical protein
MYESSRRYQMKKLVLYYYCCLGEVTFLLRLSEIILFILLRVYVEIYFVQTVADKSYGKCFALCMVAYKKGCVQ